jgi:hypothetical protein
MNEPRIVTAPNSVVDVDGSTVLAFGCIVKANDCLIIGDGCILYGKNAFVAESVTNIHAMPGSSCFGKNIARQRWTIDANGKPTPPVQDAPFQPRETARRRGRRTHPLPPPSPQMSQWNITVGGERVVPPPLWPLAPAPLDAGWHDREVTPSLWPAPSAAPAPWPAAPAPAPCDDKRACVVCMERAINIVCKPCRHAAMCSTCAEDVTASYAKCPVCNTDIRKTSTVFIA